MASHPLDQSLPEANCHCDHTSGNLCSLQCTLVEIIQHIQHMRTRCYCEYNLPTIRLAEEATESKEGYFAKLK